MSGLLDDLRWRNLIHQMTDPESLPKLLDTDVLVAYIGFDPTADSLHIGHLLQICLLRRLQLAGHRPIALVGGGTGMIGDPTGKSDERNLLTPEDLAHNKAGIQAQLERFIDFGSSGAILEDNATWLATVPLLDFLRDVGKQFTVNEMIRKDSVRSRLETREQGISFTEFSYMLLQAWDFLQLFDRHGCRLQMGGSDQWGNITEGVDLIRRRRETQAFGLTSPLVTKADGTKFGKTEAGAVWLEAAKTSPYQFFQYFIRTADAEVGSYLRYFTFLSREAIEELDRATATHPERREAQRTLAREVTGLVHGADEAARAERAAAVLFTEDIVTLDEPTLVAGLSDAPSQPITPADLDGSLSLVDALIRTGLATSRGEARRHLSAGGIYVNNRRQPEDRPVGPEDALHGRFVVLRRGRNQRVLAARDRRTVNLGVFIGDANGERTTVATLQAQAKAAEAAGFVTGWVPHIPWSLDGLTALAIAGLVTDRLELGTAVMPTYTRHPLAMAQQALSAQAAAGGRVTLGIGPSHPVVIEKMYGLGYDRPIAHVREYIGVMREAFAGSGKVVYNGELYQTDALLEVPGASPVPILVAALAPQMLRLTGAVAEGTIAYWADERAIGEHVVPLINAAAETAGRPRPRVVAGLPIAIVDDPDAVRDQAVRMFTGYTGIPTYQRILARGDAEHPVDVALIGDEAHALRRLRAFADAGATDLCAAPLGLGPDGEATKRRTLEWLSSLAPAI